MAGLPEGKYLPGDLNKSLWGASSRSESGDKNHRMWKKRKGRWAARIKLPKITTQEERK